MSPNTPFDRNQLRRQRNRASSSIAQHDFLLTEAAARLGDRLDDIARSFPLCLELGCHHGTLARQHHPKIGTLIQSDLSPAMLQQTEGITLCADEEFLPFAPNTFDAVFSVLSLHWVNDLPGTLAQIERILTPDGLFLAILPGGNTLQELRESFAHAEANLTGGMRPRVAPFIDVRDAGALLQRAGFALPVVDSDLVTVNYPNPMALLHELRAAGEASALNQRPRRFTSRHIIAAAMAHYTAHHSDNEGRINASVELITLTAWKNAPTQQQPAKRGSGKLSLASVLSKN